jgi:flagellar hook-length control protein FliK
MGDFDGAASRRSAGARETDAAAPVPVLSGTGIVAAVRAAPPVGIAAAAGTHLAVATATQHLIAEVRLLQNGATTEMHLRLRPPDLGDVQVLLRRDHAGDLAVQLTPATREAAAALETHLHHLRDALDTHSANHHAEVTLRHHDDAPAHYHQGRQHTPAGDEAEEALADETMPAASKSTVTRAQRAQSTIDYDA